ncbi:MAG: chemotaxis-specific protein-glutamate methyltransferase CheB [Magnetococcales bacterium]|nr:chemotaxis-specific protein-glutamate methyltransferase CheB [Magnetococcales bacterium]
MADPLRIMVVDDTITYRMIMKQVAESIPGTTVVASASNGQTALDKLVRDFPDVVLLDVEMPVMDGLETLKYITKHHPDVTVVMVSGLSRSNANIVMECLNAGAFDFVTKPIEANADKARNALRLDLEPILSVITQKKQRAATEPAVEAGTSRKSGDVPSSPRVRDPVQRAVAKPAAAAKGGHGSTSLYPGLVLIGSSTGGPAALTTLLASIRQPLPVPMLIVQHMPPVFTTSLALQLHRVAPFTVQEAEEALPVQPGSAILAAGGKHMVLKGHPDNWQVSLNEGPKVNECRPAVDVLFMSASTVCQGPVLAVILTGMGRDGAHGVDALKRAYPNSYCITQSRESCVVYGMPRSVDEMGLSNESLPIERIGQRIMELCIPGMVQ